MARQRSWWGWGWEDQAMTPAQVERLGDGVKLRFPDAELSVTPPVPLAEATLPPAGSPPASIAHLCALDDRARASHTYGRSYRDVVRGHRGDFAAAPAFVAYPNDEDDVVTILDAAADAGLHVTPYGGGSSVVGGVELAGAVSMDLSRLDPVLDLDRPSRAP